MSIATTTQNTLTTNQSTAFALTRSNQTVTKMVEKTQECFQVYQAQTVKTIATLQDKITQLQTGLIQSDGRLETLQKVHDAKETALEERLKALEQQNSLLQTRAETAEAIVKLKADWERPHTPIGQRRPKPGSW